MLKKTNIKGFLFKSRFEKKESLRIEKLEKTPAFR